MTTKMWRFRRLYGYRMAEGRDHEKILFNAETWTFPFRRWLAMLAPKGDYLDEVYVT